MKIGIVSRSDMGEALNLTKNIIKQLTGEELVLAPDVAKNFDESGTSIENMDVTAIVTIGGDGTVLYTLQKSPEIPILGINMGERGFLADVNPSEALEAVDKMRKNELELIEHEKLVVDISGRSIAEALNEGVVRSKEPSRVLNFRVLVNGEEAEKASGDGLIVATPTGSTAYSMAAGGPIIDPRVKAFTVVPLSTHRPKAMPLIYPMNSQLEVELLESEKKAYVTVDGQVTEEANPGDIIRFTKSKNGAKFFKWKGGFYEKLKEKI